MRPRRIFLTGLMGSGKTTVGRLLARRTGWTFCDTDAWVVKETGKTIPQIAAYLATEMKWPVTFVTSVDTTHLQLPCAVRFLWSRFHSSHYDGASGLPGLAFSPSDTRRTRRPPF